MYESNTIQVLDNINTINYIVQDCLKHVSGSNVSARNTAVKGDGYAMDIKLGYANCYNFHIRTQYLQDLCRVYLSPRELYVRYSPKFMFGYNPKTKLFSTNLFSETFTLDDMESVFFTQNCLDGWGLQVEFDCDIMKTTLNMCRKIHDDFVISIKK